jgi:hypothetical protein
MSLETYTGNISDLVATNPTGTDPRSQGDDHLRGIKYTLKQSFPLATGPVRVSGDKLFAGDSADNTKNFVIDASADDGTMKLARESGQDIMTVDAAGKVEFPQNKAPCFSARVVGGQTFTSGTASKWNCTQENFDTDSAYDAANSRFQPTVAGYYQFNVTVSISGTTVTSLGAYVRKNGVTPAEIQGYIAGLGSTTSAVSASGILYMNGTTDYAEPFAIVAGTGGLIAQPLPQGFSASLVRPE